MSSRRNEYPFNLLPNSLNPDILKELIDIEDINIPSDIEKYFISFDDDYDIKFNDDGEYIEVSFNDLSKNNDESDDLDFDISSEDSFSQNEVKNNSSIKFEHKDDSLKNNDESTEKHEANKPNKKYAIKISTNWEPPCFEPNIELPFTPDIFQLQSFYLLSQNKSVLVTAHTSSGKTTIVDYAILLSTLHKTKIIYTSPIKALSNQKYYEFQKYNPGLITGDVKININSNILIVTTEILRNLLYSRNNLLNNLEFVVFDEVHYINNADRGVVWEECIIMLPKYVNLIMLSACIPNAVEFGDWVGRIRKSEIYVISTEKRAVPLEYFICNDESLKSVFKENVSNEKETLKNNKNMQHKTKVVPTRKKDNIFFLSKHVLSKKLVPSIFFVFSRKKCHDLTKKILKPLLNEHEKNQVHKIIVEKLNKNLSPSDRNLPQIIEINNFLLNGIAVHHSGLLPILKELTEILFSKNLVKILFATETFSMGVNFPAKSVVFLSLKKRDNEGQRFLTPGEFMQMSGRAGRRNIDNKGVVIVNHFNDNERNIDNVVKTLIKSSTYLASKFKISFNMILQLLRCNTKVEDILRNSFCEDKMQKNVYKKVKTLIDLENINKYIYKHHKKIEIEEEMSKISLNTHVLNCKICLDIREYVSCSKKLYSINNCLITEFLKTNSNVFGLTAVLNNLTEIKIDKIEESNITGNLYVNIENTKFKMDYFKKVSKKTINNFVKNPILPHLSMKMENNDHTCSIKKIMYLKKADKIFFEYNLKDYRNIIQQNEVIDIFNKLNKFKCLKCPDIKLHYNQILEICILEKEIETLKAIIDDKSLSLFNDYFNKIEFMKKRKYIDEHNKILLKGRVACEIRTVDEVFMTEIITRNGFQEYNFQEIMAFVSCLIVKEKRLDENNTDLHSKFSVLVKQILKYIFEEDFSNDIFNKKIFDKNHEICFFDGFLNPIYDWCNGIKLSEIVNLYGISEGILIRTILRIDEFCREIRNVCVLVNDMNLLEKIEQALKVLKRDIVHCNSLYVEDQKNE